MSGKLKFSLYLLLFGVFTLYAAFWGTGPRTEYSREQILGAAANLQLFVEPDDGREPILAAVNAAKKEILVEVYLLSDPEIISALKDAEARGVQVRVMLEQYPFGGSGLNQKTKPELEAAGAEVRWTSASFALTHEKSLAVDNRMVCILNLNLTKSAFESNREYNICTESPAEVAEVTAIFTADWERKNLNPATANLVVSPDNSRGKLTALVNSAEKSLDLEIEVLEDRALVDLLTNKAKTVPVRVILPPLAKITTNRVAVDRLKAAGATVRVLSSPYVHAKLLVADQARAYIGSVNFSQQSLDKNRELGILISQTDVIGKLSQPFEIDWTNAKEP